MASVAAWVYVASTQSSKVLLLSYIKGEGLNEPPLPIDPAPQFRDPADYVARIARSCGIVKWTVQSEVSPDAPVMADLEIQWNDISGEMFNCLNKYVIPPRVTLKLMTKQVQTP